MGHKVNPTGFRLGITTHWTSNWYAEGKVYGENLLKDIQVRAYLRKKLDKDGDTQLIRNQRGFGYLLSMP